MCIGIPARVIETENDRGMPMGIVDFGGATLRVCLAYTPDAGIDDYVIVHAGFAISVLDEKAAAESLQYFEAMGLVEPAPPVAGDLDVETSPSPMSRTRASNADSPSSM